MYQSWVDILVEKAELNTEQLAFRFLVDGKVDGRQKTLSYQGLNTRAQAIGAHLAAKGANGERVLLVFSTGLDFIEAFLGVVYAGAIPIPVEPPTTAGQKRYDSRLKHIIESTDARFLLFSSTLDTFIRKIDIIKPLLCINPSLIADSEAENWRHPNSQFDDLALIQFTSGSTDAAQGVCISNENLIANCLAIAKAGFSINGGPHITWMPHYHDMGLVGGILGPLFCGVTSILMSPQSFARDPLRWLEAIDYFSATSSGGPCFAYARTVDFSTPAQRKNLDLSSWKVAYCGAEPINAEVMQSFAKSFKESGFDHNSFLPCYGLAEASLFVTGRKGLQTFDSDILSADEENLSYISPAKNNAVVSVGSPFDNTDIRIVSQDSNNSLSIGQVGEICIKGPGVAQNYCKDNQRGNLFNVVIDDESGFFRTGDLGFIWENELYICGRKKELIIIRGRNIYPSDIETSARPIAETLGTICIVAFSIFNSSNRDEEGFAVLVGVRSAPTDYELIRETLLKIKSAIIEACDVEPEIVALVNARDIPMTSSGKIRRTRCQKLWHSGRISCFDKVNKIYEKEMFPYIHLPATISNIEFKKTNYQFDIEKDIDWSRINEKGRYCSEELLSSTLVDISVLNAYPRLKEFYDWALALLICVQFGFLEDTVVQWCKQTRKNKHGSRRINLLEDEELKHIRLFQRFAASLAGLYPQEAESIYKIKDIAHNNYLNSFLDSSEYEDITHQHYTIWLGILYFEEYTIWVDETLKNMGNEVHHTWKQIHHCHRREEVQHIITDRAYISALGTTHEERMRWSESFFKKIQEIRFNQFEELFQLTKRLFPDINLTIENTTQIRLLRMLEMLRSPQFKITRNVAPYMAQLISEQKDSTTKITALTNATQIENSIRIVLGTIVGSRVDNISGEQLFTEIGLDSLGHLTFAAKLEQNFGYPVDSNIAYVYPTINSIVTYLEKKTETDKLHLKSPKVFSFKKIFNKFKRTNLH